MKKIMYTALLMAGALLSSLGYAEEEQALIEAVEYKRLIVNWSPNDQRLAILLAYEEGATAPKRLHISRDTELESDSGEWLPIEYLKSKVDWEGTVQTLGSQPGTAIRIMLH